MTTEGGFVEEEHLQRALGLAYRYLDQRERTESELRTYLEAKRVDATAIGESLRRLRAEGYLDDARFARLLAQDKRELEQWGNQRIRRTLLTRGIDRDVVEAALANEPAEMELDRALALLRRRFSPSGGDRRERERALGLLLRKGFDQELALEALAELGRTAREVSPLQSPSTR